MHINNIEFFIQELFNHKIIIVNIIRKQTWIKLAVAYEKNTKFEGSVELSNKIQDFKFKCFH